MPILVGHLWLLGRTNCPVAQNMIRAGVKFVVTIADALFWFNFETIHLNLHQTALKLIYSYMHDNRFLFLFSRFWPCLNLFSEASNILCSHSFFFERKTLESGSKKSPTNKSRFENVVSHYVPRSMVDRWAGRDGGVNNLEHLNFLPHSLFRVDPIPFRWSYLSFRSRSKTEASR